jgi:nucleotide-binding universal stress UspA family protein
MKLVVAYDESNSSQCALTIAIERAITSIGSKVYLVHSLTGNNSDNVERIEASEKAMDQACKKLKDQGIDCESRLLIRGFEPGEDIVQFAKEIQADEIMVGIIKRSRVEKMLLGSTAQYVILNAHCPVTTVRKTQ